MEKVDLQFLNLLKSSLKNERYKGEEIDFDNLLYIYKLSEMHHVLPMIYESVYNEEFFKKIDNGFKSMFKSMSFKIIFSQIQRSSRFLEIYKKINEKNIKILVFKGIIFRQMYNNPDSRMSADEDILIYEKDWDKLKEVLESEGMEFIDKGEECAYFCPNTGLCIEVSTSLFSKESKAYGHLNDLFLDIFEKGIEININGVDIFTMSHNHHLMYIVFHNLKHFLTGGFGIRQVADFIKYIEKYSDEINWEQLWNDLDKLNYTTFTLNLLDIGKKYLGFDDNKVIYPKDFETSNNYYINSDSLINDILDAGVFGSSTMDRKHTALMTLDAVEDKEKSNRLKAIFPNVKYLKGKYTYLEKYPILLPIAWGQRIFSYIKNNKNSSNSYINTMELGKQRIELLKEYKIIK